QRIFCPDPPPRMALIAEEHTAIGFLVMRTAGEQWEIENLVVAEPARRRGTGTALVNAALVRARSAGAEAVTLEVRETNHAALSLYERLGFVPSGSSGKALKDAAPYARVKIPSRFRATSFRAGISQSARRSAGWHLKLETRSSPATKSIAVWLPNTRSIRNDSTISSRSGSSPRKKRLKKCG